MELFLFSVLAAIVIIGLILLIRRRAIIKLIRFFNNDYLTIEDYPIKNIYGLSEISKDGRMWKITKDTKLKLIKIGNKQYPCLLIHDSVNTPLEVDIDERKLVIEMNPEITQRIAEQRALRELLKPKIEITNKQMLIYILMGLIGGVGIGVLIGGIFR
ncbi:MAG: hypothetical protein QXS37_03765 [Candidatus Aenigmatarchaeota archaeon]